jgi:hypothetical protein
MPLTPLLVLHVSAGAISLVAFWIAVAVKKGGPIHVWVGRLFVRSMYVVAVSAILLCVTPLIHRVPRGGEWAYSAEQVRAYVHMRVFLGYLAIVVLADLRHGVRVLQFKRDPKRLRTPLDLFLNSLSVLCGAAMLVFGFRSGTPLFIGLSPIGMVVGLRNLRYLLAKSWDDKSWFYAHLRAMLGNGIAAHTAFFAFGSRRLFELPLRGNLILIPWLLPIAVGLPCTYLLIWYYKRKIRQGSLLVF